MVVLGGLKSPTSVVPLAQAELEELSFFFFCITLGLELSDAKVYAP